MRAQLESSNKQAAGAPGRASLAPSTRASLAPGAASAAPSSAASDAELAKFKLRAEKLTANLLASKSLEKELKSEASKWKLEFELRAAQLADREREVAELTQQLALKQQQPQASGASALGKATRKSVGILKGSAAAAAREADKENAINA